MSISDFSQVTVLVTGGAGFIGSNLVDELLARGAKVKVLDNLATGFRHNLAHVEDQIDWVEADMRDVDACQRACDGAEVMFHQAALGSVPRSLQDPATSIAVNVAGTSNLFAAARDAKVRRIVYASSSSVYGDHPALPKKEGQEGRVLSPYAASKKMCEDLADIYGRSFDLELVGLRYFNVYGPRQSPQGAYAAVIPLFFDAYKQAKTPTIFGDGETSRDFTFVKDAVRANLLAASAPAKACGMAYNVAAGQRTTLNQLAEQIRKLMHHGPPPRHTNERPGDVRHSLADLSKVRQGLGYMPQFDLAQGLAETAKDFR